MSATSCLSGHEIVYFDNCWVKADTLEQIPDDWYDRNKDLYSTYIDSDGKLKYKKNDEIVKPCAKCGEYPSERGDDFCIQNLGHVLNACCGHGEEGYIQFENGITVRGVFKVGYWNKEKWKNSHRATL